MIKSSQSGKVLAQARAEWNNLTRLHQSLQTAPITVGGFVGKLWLFDTSPRFFLLSSSYIKGTKCVALFRLSLPFV
jgi:hypothetical protein